MTNISICIGSACHLKGSYNIIQLLQQELEERGLHDKVDVKASFCVKECGNKGVAVTIDDTSYSVFPDSAAEFFEEKLFSML